MTCLITARTASRLCSFRPMHSTSGLHSSFPESCPAETTDAVMPWEACGQPCAASVRHALRQVAGADRERRLVSLAQQGADGVRLFAVQQRVHPATGHLHGARHRCMARNAAW